MSKVPSIRLNPNKGCNFENFTSIGEDDEDDGEIMKVEENPMTIVNSHLTNECDQKKRSDNLSADNTLRKVSDDVADVQIKFLFLLTYFNKASWHIHKKKLWRK